MTITERIFEQIKQKGINQKEFAHQIGVNEKTFSAWKVKNTLPSADKISVISDLLNVSIEYLLTGEDPTAPQNTADRELLELIENLSSEEREKAKTFIRFMLSERSSGSSERSDSDTSYEAKEEAV